MINLKYSWYLKVPFANSVKHNPSKYVTQDNWIPRIHFMFFLVLQPQNFIILFGSVLIDLSIVNILSIGITEILVKMFFSPLCCWEYMQYYKNWCLIEKVYYCNISSRKAKILHTDGISEFNGRQVALTPQKFKHLSLSLI